jgi:hypothetical protein
MNLLDGLSKVFIYLSVIFVLSVCRRWRLALFTHTHRTPSLPPASSTVRTSDR